LTRSKLSLIQIKIHGRAFNAYGIIILFLKDEGIISVGDKLVNTKAKTSRETSVIENFPIIPQIATPLMAIIKVGDSALWLKITIQIRTDENISKRKLKKGY